MNEREAFEAYEPNLDEIDSVGIEPGEWALWQAACAYQRKKDAEKCMQGEWKLSKTAKAIRAAILKGDE